jgi:cytochrome c
MKTLRVGLAAMFVVFPVHSGVAQTAPDVQQGHSLVQTHCGTCHAINKAGLSPLSMAPPFRDLHKRYPVEYLEEALAEGISTGHAAMPEFRFEPDQIRDLIAYLKSLE